MIDRIGAGVGKRPTVQLNSCSEPCSRYNSSPDTELRGEQTWAVLEGFPGSNREFLKDF